MGPSCRRRTRSTRKSSSRKTLFKKKPQNSKKNQEISVISSPSSTSAAKPSSNDSVKIDSGSIDCDQSIDMLSTSTSSACSTPKAERFRIPEITTCPPAPKKRKIVTSCSLRRSPITFFDPPDIELFFYFALRGISAWYLNEGLHNLQDCLHCNIYVTFCLILDWCDLSFLSGFRNWKKILISLVLGFYFLACRENSTDVLNF